MDFNGVQIKLTLMACIVAAAAAAAAQPKAHCRTTCGKVTIPYPFGTSEGCYRDKTFLISCNTTSGKPMPYLPGNIQVLDISLSGELRVLAHVSKDCYNSYGHRDPPVNMRMVLPEKFVISNTKNKFTVVGCDTNGFISDCNGNRFSTGCSLICSDIKDVKNSSFSGVGFCQTTFPKAIMGYNISLESFSNHSRVWNFSLCSYAFVAEDSAFNFSSLDLRNLGNGTKFPMILNWAIENKTCTEAMKNSSSYACKGNSDCVDSESGIGYYCKYKDGFKGNPYLCGPKGCQGHKGDDSKKGTGCELENQSNSFVVSQVVLGHKGDDSKKGTGCELKHQSNSSVVSQVVLGISVALLVLGIVLYLFWARRKRKLADSRKKYFKKNGGIMLQKQLSQRGYNEITKLFTQKELKEATNNFHESRILGSGGQGTVFKGILPDNRVVAIKKSKIVDQSQVKDFINEVLVLSRVNHRNVVKLLGCCLETEVPLLVYEFIPNGTLLDHIDPERKTASIPWETRLRIAAETAGAISYLHSAASVSIIHRDIKSNNILVDHNYTAKVSDFGVSKLVKNGAQFTTLLQGTLGYLDPEFLYTSQLTEKTDVYSFGVVLVELLTGMKVIEFTRPEEERNLAMYFVSSMRKGHLPDVLDCRIVDEENVQQIKEVAALARRCVKVKGEERPTMKEVSMELEGLIAKKKHPCQLEEGNMNSEDEYSFSHVSAGCGTSSGGDSVRYYSSQLKFEIEDGR